MNEDNDDIHAERNRLVTEVNSTIVKLESLRISLLDEETKLCHLMNNIMNIMDIGKEDND